MSQTTSLPEGTIVRRVRVNRTRSLQEALDVSGRKFYGDREVVATAPMVGRDEEVEVLLIPLGRPMADERVEELIPVGFRSADPWELVAVNEDDSSFADNHPNFTHWQNANKKWCWAAFRKWDCKRVVHAYRSDDVWDAYWYLAVVREEQKQD